MSTLAYLDSSALVKLVFEERESDALIEFLLPLDWISSALTRVEVLRSARRSGVDGAVARAQHVLSRMNFVRLDDAILAAAAGTEPRDLRSLDALHLVSALSLGPNLDGIVVYDRRLADAARHAGLTIWAPA